MDMKTANAIAARMQELIEPLAAEFGVTIERQRGSFDPDLGLFNPKFRITDVQADGTIKTPESEALKMLRPDLVGKTFKDPEQGNIEFTGYYTRRSKYPLVYQVLSTGKRYKTNEAKADMLVKMAAVAKTA